MERGGRMVDRHIQNAAQTPILPVFARDGDARIDQSVSGEAPERADNCGIDEGDLGEQVLPADLDLRGLGIAIARWTALHDIGDEHTAAVETDAAELFAENAAGAADKGPPLPVLFGPGTLSDEHDASIRCPLARHSLPPAAGERAEPARADLAVNLLQGFLGVR
jgi:hypothetical protein